jgi:predicted permease
VRGARFLAAFAAEPLRSTLRAEAAPTVEAVCSAALERRGWLGLVGAGVAEWRNVAFAVVRSRLGARAAVTAGRLPTPSRTPGDSSMTRFAHDLRQAWRGLFATRSVVALAALTLALGVGVNTAVFSVLDSLLFRPVPFTGADRLSTLWSYYEQGKFSIKGRFDAPLVIEWRKQTDLFSRVEASETKSFIFEGATGADMVAGSVVTPGLFAMLGARPAEGRVFSDGDGRAGTSRLAVISHRFWRERLGGDRAAIGRDVVLDGERHEIIGIMPPSFLYPDERHDVWLPFDVSQPPAAATSFTPLVRLQPGLKTADVEAKVMARGAEVQRAAGGKGDGSARLMAIGQVFDERTTRSLVVLGGAVLCLLLIVCANVANLTLARAFSRTRDLAIRIAMGASRRDLLRVAFLEHAVLGTAGGVLAIGVAYLTLQTVTAVLPDAMTSQTMNAIDLDGRALAWLTLISAATVIAFGVPPALFASRASVSSMLGRDSRSATGSPVARRLRSVLVVAEVSLSIVLLVGAALVTRSLMKLQAIDIGMDTDGLVAMQIALPARGYSDPVLRDQFTRDLIARARQHPGISRASAGTLPPDQPTITVGPVETGDRPGETTKPTLMPVYAAWPGYFEAAGIRLLEGRELHEGDIEGAAVVSGGFAAKYWPGRSALGARFKVGKAPWRTVVGVAAEIQKLGPDANPNEHELYYPPDQMSGVMFGVRVPAAIAEYRTLIVRTERPGQAARELAAIVHGVDGRVIVSRTSLVAHEFADAIARPRIVFVMMAVFAGVGLLLAAAGLYGVLSYLVAQRQREIGIRLALGAGPRDVGRQVLGRGLAMVAVGLGIGLAAALALVGVMKTVLYEVDPKDPVALAAAIGAMAATALIACWRPMRRAMQIDPVQLLKE